MLGVVALTLATTTSSFVTVTDGGFTCNDTLLNNTGLGAGGTVAQLANVSSLGDCCSLCHTLEHDFCAGWVFGQTGSDEVWEPELPPHNCAIMAKNGPRAHVQNHISAIVRSSPAPAPPPTPLGPACRADLDCNPGCCFC